MARFTLLLTACVLAQGAPAALPRTAGEAGRRILSTAFVRVGPDGWLTVTLGSGRTLVLRGVAMGPTRFCGRLPGAGTPGKRYCGRYADVVAARPGSVAANGIAPVDASDAAGAAWPGR
jgi:hypothetical protein